MAIKPKPPENCLLGGCDTIGKCSRCGFDREENERRKKIQLVRGNDGIRRKIIQRSSRQDDVPEEKKIDEMVIKEALKDYGSREDDNGN